MYYRIVHLKHIILLTNVTPINSIKKKNKKTFTRFSKIVFKKILTSCIILLYIRRTGKKEVHSCEYINTGFILILLSIIALFSI